MRSIDGGIALVSCLLVASSLPAEELAPGVTYTVHAAPGPTTVYVVKIDRLRAEYKLQLGWSQGKRNYTARETVDTITNRYGQPAGGDVISAINASYFDGVTAPRLIGIGQSDGQMLDTPSFNGDYTYHTLMVGPARQPTIRTNFGHSLGTLTLPDGHTMPLAQYNYFMGGPLYPVNGIVAFTPEFDNSTRSSFISPSIAVEVVVSGVSYPMRGDKEVAGIVTAINHPTTGNAPIPAGGMVLSTWGNEETRRGILDHAHIGDRLKMRFASQAEEYNISDNAVTGIGWIIHQGAAYTAGWQNLESGAAPYSRNPRSVMAWNNDFWFQVVCDGRGVGGSVGMTFQEMADFLTGTLAATEAVNFDGGGSATLVVNGQVRNRPSDGSPRPVANALLLVNRDTTTVFPFSDPFASTGRLSGWDDKFRYADVVAFSPVAPGGDGYVLRVMNSDGGVDTCRRGDFGDTDYSVQADIYCEYRPDVTDDGFERYGLFARDSGTGAFTLSHYGGGNGYALLYDSNNGRIRAGKLVNGTPIDFLATPVYEPSTAWRTFRIECRGGAIRYLVDGQLIASAADTDFAHGCFGIGYQESFATNSNMHGTRADNFTATDNAGPLLPAAEFTASPAAGVVPLRVQFTDSSAGGMIDTWLWEFGDQTTSNVRNPTHVYLTARTYTVSLTVSGPGGSSTKTKHALIDAQPKPGDLDADNDVDGDDFARLQLCLAGAGHPVTDATCKGADLTGEGDVDRNDITRFIKCVSGAGISSDRDCLGN
ncbi:MAG TPA: phosphodiester glycosidase family protein [Phycisphaerae bacterium]|nr:phosphodiester glycosidase family protein [Phycisphaerae bacterium]HRY70252.1 phosphodiester glycosidase family protein [Phycisphaerae bacterium]HSA27577.1 phosphodiester glycosidase family protein [Phycisphaerae bacterium]